MSMKEASMDRHKLDKLLAKNENTDVMAIVIALI
jgi:hypothetical protein